jgi:hypothetical protein
VQDSKRPELTKRLSYFDDSLSQRAPRLPASGSPLTTGVFFTHPYQIVPLAISTQFNQWKACQPSIGNQCTMCRHENRRHFIEQLSLP